MKAYIPAAAIVLAAAVPTLFAQAPALNGEPYIHDPSTIAFSDGKYFTFGTGGGGLISEDGWTWHGGAQRPGGGVAPDVIKIGDRYYMSYARGGGGMSGGHASNVYVMWTKSLDPASPDFKFNDETLVASTDGVEDCDAIDPAFLLDPATGRLWLSYGTYFGYIRIVELDPKTGKRVAGNKAVDVAIDMEATDLVARDGWYYLLGTHGTCCDGANSTYNIRVGRSRNVLGPYVDNMGIPLLKGGGKLVVAASRPLRRTRPLRQAGLGRWRGEILDALRSRPGPRRPERAGYSPAALEGWMAGGRRQFLGRDLRNSVRTERLCARAGGGFRAHGGTRRRFRRPRRRRWTRTRRRRSWSCPAGPPAAPAAPAVQPVQGQRLYDVLHGWPTGNIDLRIGDYMMRPHQKWTITPVLNAGGYPGSPYFKIQIADTDRTLAAAENNEVVTVPTFTGAPEQLWRIDQLTDGTYRIMPKAVPNSTDPVALSAVGASTPTLAKFDPKSDKGRWTFRKP